MQRREAAAAAVHDSNAACWIRPDTVWLDGSEVWASFPKIVCETDVAQDPASVAPVDLDVDVDVDFDMDMDMVGSLWGSSPAPAVDGGTTAVTVGQKHAPCPFSSTPRHLRHIWIWTWTSTWIWMLMCAWMQ